jgi:NTP pyrophosphatase (non-canonical NTP hydrolase)
MSKEYNVTGLNNLTKGFSQFQIDTGFDNPDVSQRLMLAHSEISEAFEAYRKDHWTTKPNFELCASDQEFKEVFEKEVKDTVEDELADTIIRLLAFCGENDIDIEYHIMNKMKYNHLRGFKFGGKKF